MNTLKSAGNPGKCRTHRNSKKSSAFSGFVLWEGVVGILEGLAGNIEANLRACWIRFGCGCRGGGSGLSSSLELFLLRRLLLPSMAVL